MLFRNKAIFIHKALSIFLTFSILFYSTNAYVYSSSARLTRTSKTLDAEYTGQPIQHSTQNGDLFSWSGEGSLTFEYYLDPFGTPTYSESGADTEFSAPSYAGQYYMKAILKNSNGDEISSSKQFKFYIKEASVPETPVDNTPKLTKTNSTLDIYYTGMPAKHSSINGDLFTWGGTGTLSFEYYSTGNTEISAPPVEVGSYTLRAALNYGGSTVYSDYLDFQILPASPQLKLNSLPKIFYTGAPISLSYQKGQVFSWLGNGNLKYTFFKDAALTIPTDSSVGASTHGSEPSLSGKYYLTVDLSESAGYTSDTISSIEINILPIEFKNSQISTNISLSSNILHNNTYNLYDMLSLPQISGKWEITDKIDTSASIKNFQLNEGKLSISALANGACRADFTVIFTPDYNYLPYEANISVSFYEKTKINIDIIADNKVFDGKEFLPTIKSSELYHALIKIDYFTSKNLQLAAPPTRPGKYMLKASVNSDTFASNTVTKYFEIYPLPIKVLNINANDKYFDATTSAKVDFTNAKLDGLAENFNNVSVNFDNVKVNFLDKFSGGKIVATGLTITGSDADCYTLLPVDLSAKILPLDTNQAVAMDGKSLIYTSSSDNSFTDIFNSYPAEIKNKFKTQNDMYNFFINNAGNLFENLVIDSVEMFDISHANHTITENVQLALGVKCSESCICKLLHIRSDGTLENVTVAKVNYGLTTADKVSLSPFMLIHTHQKPSVTTNFTVKEQVSYTEDADKYWSYVLEKLLNAPDSAVVMLQDIKLDPPQFIMDLLEDRPTLNLVLFSDSSSPRIFSALRKRIPNPSTGM